jgi:hypothetical protein
MDVKKIFLATLSVPTLVKRFIIISTELDGTTNDNPVPLKFFS